MINVKEFGLTEPTTCRTVKDSQLTYRPKVDMIGIVLPIKDMPMPVPNFREIFI
jgi:hypothetical protein